LQNKRLWRKKIDAQDTHLEKKELFFLEDPPLEGENTTDAQAIGISRGKLRKVRLE
jgi:hypothetical protein